MIQEKALRMALEALRKARRKVLTTEECHAVIMSIKEALAQPEQIPPSAYSNTHQPEQEPVVGTKTWFEDGKVVTQYLYPSDIYTTPPQPEQEPVAWRFQSPTGGWAYAKEPPLGFKYAAEPLYTHPPQSFTYEQVKAHIQVALLSLQPVVEESLTTEPVAWINFCGFTGEMTVDFDCESELASIPLYKKEQL